MTKEENPQTQERDFPLSWKAQTPHNRFALLATFPTYPQISRTRQRGK
jgi:hypothetical protein